MLAISTTKKLIPAATFVLVFLFVFNNFALAESMSSPNYRVQTDSLNMGGNNSTSASYSAQDTLGEWSTGEDLTSALYRSCTGFQCFESAPFVEFSVTSGLTPPGVTGSPIPLGLLTTTAVTTSNGTSIKSIFMTLSSNAEHGTVVYVRDSNAGLKRVSNPLAAISSATATLSPGTAGYGLCVFSVTQGADSPSVFSSASPFNGFCDKTSLHDVGGVATTNQGILQVPGPISAGSAEVLVKASISSTTPAGNDFADSLIFVASSTF